MCARAVDGSRSRARVLRAGLKQALGGILRNRVVNGAMRLAVRPLASALPIEWLMRLPVVTTVQARLPSGRVLRLRSDGRDALASAIHWRGLAAYEPGTFPVLDRILATVDVFLDVGANSGLYALYVALERPSAMVLAIEPAPASSASLARNVRENRLANVACCEAAACDRDGSVGLFVPPGESLPLGASTLATFRDPGARLEVAAVRLDTLVSERRIARVDALKLDTEGTEPAVLAGARALLERDQPWIVCEVLHGLTEQALHAELDRFGYRYFWITARGLEQRARIVGDPAYVDRNWLFATPRRLESARGLAELLR